MAAAGLAAAGLGGGGLKARGEEAKALVKIGSGYHTYELDEHWGRLPEGMKFGLGCGVIVDSKDRIFVTSRSTNPCVSIWDPAGNLLETWSNDFAAAVGFTTAQVADTAHCLYLRKENGEEFIYWTENASTNKQGPKFGARVYKTDMRGKILYQIGNVEREGSASQKFAWDSPTDVAVAPNGDIYVVDGYGSQRVTRFDRNFKELRTIGGKGTEDGKFKTCHGVWVTTLKGREPEVYIADRESARIQVFDLELNHKRNLTGDVRRPCCFYQHGDHLFVPDLGSRVTIFDRDDKVAAQLGDGRTEDGRKERPDNKTNPGLFAAPHALTVDSAGNLYVVEWVNFGRPRKFKHTPA